MPSALLSVAALTKAIAGKICPEFRQPSCTNNIVAGVQRGVKDTSEPSVSVH